MAIFLPFAKVRRLPPVLKAYGSEKTFAAAVKAEAEGSHVWARYAPGTNMNSGSANLQCDVTAIPNVPVLTVTGSLA